MPKSSEPPLDTFSERRARVSRGLRDSGRAPLVLAVIVFTVVGVAVWALANWTADNVANAPERTVEADDALASVADDPGAAPTNPTGSGPDTSTIAATSPPTPDLSVTMGMVNNTTGTRLLFENGPAIADANVAINANVLPTDAVVLDELANGRFDIALVSSTVALQAWHDGAEIDLVGAGVAPAPGSAVVTTSDPSLSATDLGTTPVQLQRIGGLADVALTLWLADSEVADPGRIEVVSANGAPAERTQPVMVGPGCDDTEVECAEIVDLFESTTVGATEVLEVPVDVLVVRTGDGVGAEMVDAIALGFADHAFGDLTTGVLAELAELQKAAGGDLQREGSPLLAS